MTSEELEHPLFDEYKERMAGFFDELLSFDSSLTRQEQRILDYLRNNGKINPLQAWQECGGYRLSAVIFNLKKKRIVIQSDRVKVSNRFNEDCSVAEYKLIW